MEKEAKQSSVPINEDIVMKNNNFSIFKPRIVSTIELTDLLDNSEIWIGTDWHLWKADENGILTKNKNFDLILNNCREKLKRPNSLLLFLGDLVDDEFNDLNSLRKAIKSLNGTKILIKGNNDILEDTFYTSCGFEYVLEGLLYNDILFTHAPIDNIARINVHGHLHKSGFYYDNNFKNHADVFTGKLS